MKEGLRALKEVVKPSGKRIAVVEGPTGCNRSCSYCTVPQRWDAEKASTLDQTNKQIDWLRDQGFRVLQYVGGETLTPFFKTREGLAFQEHTLEIVRYAKKKGMLTNVSTNGDYLNEAIVQELKEAGLDTLTISLHSYNEPGLRHALKGARMAAEAKIPTIISAVFTSDRAETIPEVAKRCAENGIIFATTVVQEHGGGFSAIPEKSLIPTTEQQKKVFDALTPLKRAGFINDNNNYLQHAPTFPNNSWVCDPERDSFIHVRAIGEKGEVRVCTEVPTEFKAGEISLNDEKWREAKKNLVKNCSGCLMRCTFEGQNPDLIGDFTTFAMMGLIKMGQAELVRKLGQRAVEKARTPQTVQHPALELTEINQSREQILQQGISVTINPAKKKYNWDNVPKKTLFQIKAVSSVPALLTLALSATLSAGAHSAGTSSPLLDVISGLFAPQGIAVSTILYNSIKNSFENDYEYDRQKEKFPAPSNPLPAT